ncbi:unnamed protein product [Xylocopa violacea]|uniref:Nucleolus and neural progenitor protein-like N-terminal domain-containing protein n=1 Tax=Xylocopa violacea TaxID=135666 RepID=A0ABP1N0V1_XYLVO
MEAIWNLVQLEHPPNATCRVEHQRFDATEFLRTLDKVIKDLNSQELLHKEAAILSRLIYRMKKKFRNDKGVKSMCKLNRALLKYLSLSLQKEYNTLKDYVEADGIYNILPSKQMVEYVLIKTQGFAKLMLRVEEVSKYSAHFLKCRINLGHAWSIAIIAYAVVSRIWILSRYLVKNSCTWYNCLYQYLNSLEDSGSSWLPANYKLTNDLKSWLSVSWINEPTPSVPSNYGLKNTMFKLITPRDYDSDEDLFFDIQDYNKKTEPKNVFSCMQRANTMGNSFPRVESKNIVPNDETGEKRRKQKISVEGDKREPYFENTEDQIVATKRDKNGVKPKILTKNKGLKQLLTLDDVKNKTDLAIFLNRESYPGMNKLQWNMIRTKGKKLLDKSETCSDNKKQSISFKKMMKRIKKCFTQVH